MISCLIRIFTKQGSINPFNLAKSYASYPKIFGILHAPAQIAHHAEAIHPPQDLNAKWDACLDLSTRRSLQSSLVGTLGGLPFFRSPATRRASVAFGAVVGIGSAYTECSYLSNGSSTKPVSPKISDTSAQHTPIQELDREQE